MKSPDIQDLTHVVPRLAELDPDELTEYATYATLVVEAHLYHAVFDTWADGTPIDVGVRALVTKAVAFQIQAWVKEQVKPWENAPAPAASVSLGPASITYETGSDGSELHGNVTALAPFPAQILRPLYQQPRVRGYGWTA